MNSFLVIAVLVLTGFSLSSAASLNFGGNEVPDLKENFEEILQALLRGASEQLADVGSFGDFDVNTKHGDDQSPFVTEENEEYQAVKVSSVANDRGFCVWHDHVGACCTVVYFHGVRLLTCMKVVVKPQSGIHIHLVVNKHSIVEHFIANNKTYTVCASHTDIKLCWIFHNVLVTSDHAQMCLLFVGRYKTYTYAKNVGCVVKKFSDIKRANGSSMKLTQVEQNEDISSILNEDMQTDEILNFLQ